MSSRLIVGLFCNAAREKTLSRRPPDVCSASSTELGVPSSASEESATTAWPRKEAPLKVWLKTLMMSVSEMDLELIESASPHLGLLDLLHVLERHERSPSCDASSRGTARARGRGWRGDTRATRWGAGGWERHGV